MLFTRDVDALLTVREYIRESTSMNTGQHQHTDM